MAVCSFGYQTYFLDALGAVQATSATAVVAVQTDTNQPVLNNGSDNQWGVDVLWNSTTGRAQAFIVDMNTNSNANSSALPCVLQIGTPGVRPASPMVQQTAAYQSFWEIVAAAAVQTFDGPLPVLLSQYFLNSKTYLCAAAAPASAPAAASQLSANATRWSLDYLGVVNTSFLAWPCAVTPTVNQTVDQILTELWNSAVGTEWADRWAPLLIAWAYDYPAAHQDSSTWTSDLQPLVACYVAYFVNNPAKPGWGTGVPPTTVPPGSTVYTPWEPSH